MLRLLWKFSGPWILPLASLSLAVAAPAIAQAPVHKPIAPSSGPRRPATTTAAPAMRNKDVIDMTTSGLSEDVVIDAIRHAPKCRFDLTAAGLIALKKAKVADAVIRTMQSQANGAGASEGLPKSGADSEVSTPAATPPPPLDLTLPAGSEVKVQVTKELSSESAKIGDHLYVEVTNDVTVDGHVVIKKGSISTGRITNATPQRLTRAGKLEFTIDVVKAVDGSDVRLNAVRTIQAGKTAGIRGKEANLPAGSILAVTTTVDAVIRQLPDAPVATEARTNSTPAQAPAAPARLPTKNAPAPATDRPAPATSTASASVQKYAREERPSEGPQPTPQSAPAPGAQQVEVPAATDPSAQDKHELTRQERRKIEKDLEGMYEMSKIGIFDDTKVDKIGGVYAIVTDGVQSSTSIHSDLAYTYIVDGKVRTSSDSGAGKLLGAVLNGKVPEDARALKRGDRIYLTGVNAYGNGLAVDFMTVETFPIVEHGQTRQAAYKGRLMFTAAIRGGSTIGFPAVSDATGMKKIVDAIVLSEAQASAPKTIELGQTIDQVEAIFGKPLNVIKLGEKTIYAYKDLKITFKNNKVTDVQ
jgi:hypothetical protein